MTREELTAAGANPDEMGQRVECAMCHRAKTPIGRSAPFAMATTFCDRGCIGYYGEPHVGSLWPGETREEYGH